MLSLGLVRFPSQVGKDESSGAYEARLKSMRDVDMSFGSGNRTCLGRPLALVELYKVTSTLFGKYNVSTLQIN